MFRLSVVEGGGAWFEMQSGGGSEAEKKFGYEITKFERIHKYERNQTTLWIFLQLTLNS